MFPLNNSLGTTHLAFIWLIIAAGLLTSLSPLLRKRHWRVMLCWRHGAEISSIRPPNIPADFGNTESCSENNNNNNNELIYLGCYPGARKAHWETPSFAKISLKRGDHYKTWLAIHLVLVLQTKYIGEGTTPYHSYKDGNAWWNNKWLWLWLYRRELRWSDWKNHDRIW